MDIVITADGRTLLRLDAPLSTADEPTLTLLLGDTALALRLIAAAEVRPEVQVWRLDSGLPEPA
jgi:hypothetical protein